MTRYLLAALAATGALALTPPAAGACDLEHCPGTSTVCTYVECDPLFCLRIVPICYPR